MDDPKLRQGALEWRAVLQPMMMTAARATTASPKSETQAGGLSDPSLGISLNECTKLAAGSVTIVDVRDRDSFATAHIPGAMSVPLESISDAVDQLKKLGKPIVTYCS